MHERKGGGKEGQTKKYNSGARDNIILSWRPENNSPKTRPRWLIAAFGNTIDETLKIQRLHVAFHSVSCSD